MVDEKTMTVPILHISSFRPERDLKRSAKAERGFTLLELIVAATILTILTLLALPLARVTIQRER